MSRLCLLVVFVACANNFVVAKMRSRVLHSFVEHEIVPDVLSTGPVKFLSITFPDGEHAWEGNVLNKIQVAGIPTLEWDAQSDNFYTLVMCDPDAPSRAEPEARSFLHWLVVNIPAGDVAAGETITSLVNSNPGPGTGPHRYIFLVYEQPGFVEFQEEPDDSFDRRISFSPEYFANKYNMGPPLAGNFYVTENMED